MLARNEISRDYAYNRKLFARTSHGFYVLNPALLLRQGESWTPIYERLNPPQIDRYLGHRESIEKVVALQAQYACNPDTVWDRLDAPLVEADPASDETPDRTGRD